MTLIDVENSMVTLEGVETISTDCSALAGPCSMGPRYLNCSGFYSLRPTPKPGKPLLPVHHQPL